MIPVLLRPVEKVSKLIREAYENRDEAWPGKMKYRAIVWCLPCSLLRKLLQLGWPTAWGIDVLVEMESLNFTKPLETEDKEEAHPRPRPPVRAHGHASSHTNGGYHNVVTELWTVSAKQWDAKLHPHVSERLRVRTWQPFRVCLTIRARERGYDLIWIEHDLMDPRTVSRRDHARQGQRVHAHR